MPQPRHPLIIIMSLIGSIFGISSFVVILRNQATIVTNVAIIIAALALMIALLATFTLAASQSSLRLLRLMGRTGFVTLVLITFGSLSSGSPSSRGITYTLVALATLGIGYLVFIMFRVGLSGTRPFEHS